MTLAFHPATPERWEDVAPGQGFTEPGRQILHCTFGSVLTSTREDGSLRFRDRLVRALQEDEETHYDALETHFDRHLAPFDAGA